MIYRFTTATLLAQGAAAGRQLQLSCNTGQVATCFANNGSGMVITLVPGTMSSWDGLEADTQLSLWNKYASIACSEEGGVCVWQGANPKRVVKIKDNFGTTTLEGLTIKEGDNPGEYGGGLYVHNSNVVLIIVAFIDNATSYGGAIYVVTTGSSTVTLQGCSFAGNTAAGSAPDVYNYGQTVVIGGCPTGEDKPRLRPDSDQTHSSLPPICPLPN